MPWLKTLLVLIGHQGSRDYGKARHRTAGEGPNLGALVSSEDMEIAAAKHHRPSAPHLGLLPPAL
jgi:hypothetical protein